MEDKKLIEKIAGRITARENCIEHHNATWEKCHEDVVNYLCENYLPPGSGFDNGVQVDFEASTDDKIILVFGFHHMGSHGMYTGWLYYRAVVTPAFVGGFALDVECTSVPDDVEEISEYHESDLDYFGEALQHALSHPITDADRKKYPGPKE